MQKVFPRYIPLVLILIIALGILLFTDSAVPAQSGVAISRFLARLALLFGIGFPLVFMALAKLFGRQQARAVYITGAVLLGSTLVSLVAAEFVVRFAFRDITTTGDRSYFTTRWRASHPPSINRHGFREYDFETEPAMDTYRIAVIGDSFTYGQGIDREDRFTDLLSSALNKTGEGKYEVLNFGKSGAETIDHVTFLEDYVLEASPDFILLQWYVNDVEVDKSGRPQPKPLVPSYVLSSFLHEYSALYYLLNRQWGVIQQRFGMLESYEDYMVRRYRDNHSADMEISDRALEKFFAIARMNDVPAAVMMFPTLDGQIESGLGFLIDHVAEVCARNGVKCIDLRPVFATVESGSDLWASRLDSHPNRLANELAVSRIIEQFAGDWRVDVRTSEIE